MSSDTRSSSAVRNLRSIFETQASETNSTSHSLIADSRGRSPNGIGSDKENAGRLKSKVRASFVDVEPVPAAVSETVVGKAMPGTPANMWGALESDALESKIEQEPVNPDKPVMGKEEEPGDMKPAELSNEQAVSGGEALPPVAQDLRTSEPPRSAKSTKQVSSKTMPTVTSKPAATSTKPSIKPTTTSVKSPVSQPKTPLSAKASRTIDSPTAKRPPRSSLTAPTAASMARAGTLDKAPSSKTSPTASSKPRTATKPLSVPSHLTAPTASSKAKHEPEAPAVSTLKTTLVHRPKQQVSTAKSRSSLAAAPQSTSRESSQSTRKSLPPVNGSFLDRMTRATAASASRTSEKIEARSPPSKTKAKSTTKPKSNGVARFAGKIATQTMPTAHSSLQPPVEKSDTLDLSFTKESNTIEEAIAAVDAQVTAAGSQTPTHTHSQATPALEATPAGIAVDDTIR